MYNSILRIYDFSTGDHRPWLSYSIRPSKLYIHAQLNEKEHCFIYIVIMQTAQLH